MLTESVLIHVDGGPRVGLGHAARGVTLASALTRAGLVPTFAIPEDNTLAAWIAQRAPSIPITRLASVGGRELISIARDARALVIDSYRFDSDAVRQLTDQLPVTCFDDGGRLDMPVDVLVNGAPFADRLPYRTKHDTARLLGPRYQVVREAIRERASAVLASRTSVVKTVIVLIGGGRPDPMLVELIDAVAPLCARAGAELHVVVGPYGGQDVHRLEARAIVHHAPPEIAPLMRLADVAISAGGQTLYELAFLGVPTVAVAIGDDQVQHLAAVAETGAVLSAGCAGDTAWTDRVTANLRRIIDDRDLRATLGQTAARLIDGQGVARIADAIADRVQRVEGTARPH